jgi:tetratricopeptide (TPR) repeat protein
MPYSPLQMAEAFMQAGELADALDMLDAHLAANPGDAAARRGRAAARSRLGGEDNWRAALADLDALDERTPDDEVRRAILLTQVGDAAGARAALARAHERAPDDERILERYIDALEVVDARALVDTLPKTWGWLKKAGDLAVKAGDDAAAVGHYTEALERLHAIAPTHHAILANQRGLLTLSRATLCFRLGRYREAAADYAAAMTAFPNDRLIPFQRGLAVYLAGDPAAGLEWCREALEGARTQPATYAAILTLLRDPDYAALALGVIE